MSRQKKSKRTPPNMAEYNAWLQRQHLTRLIKENFTAEDYFIVLHYDKANRPSLSKAADQLRKYIRTVRKEYRTQGAEVKYIKATSSGTRGGISHYLILNAIDGGVFTSPRFLASYWQYCERLPTIKRLGDYDTPAKLARFILAKVNENKAFNAKSFISSRGLEKSKRGDENE